jgi:hypothetical protein
MVWHMTMQIKVMHDYQCHPLWVLRDGDEVSSDESPEDLGLSPALAGRLEAWGHWGESRINMADPHDSRAVSELEEAAFDAEGRLLAGRVAVELPSASVRYYNDDNSR